MAKYADRFRPVPAAPDHPEREVLDLGELSDRPPAPDDHDEDELNVGAPPSHRWHDNWVTRLAVVTALVIGVAGGAVGWDRWQAYEVSVAARGEVDLNLSALPMNYPAEDEVELAVRYRNDGEHEVIIRDVRFDSDHVTVIGEPMVLTIAPGETGTHLLDLRAECPTEDFMAEPPPLELEVETVDGTVRRTMIDSNLGSDLVGWFGYACQSMGYVEQFANTYGEIVSVHPVEDGSAVRASIAFGYGESSKPTITDVESGSSAFTVSYPVDGSATTSGGSITVLLGVGDCALARAATDRDMSLLVRGAYDDTAPGEVTVAPSSRLAAELVRLTDRLCPA